MQYIWYENCGSEEGILKEIRRMVQERFMTPEQGEMVDPAILASFFATPLGQQLKNGAKCIREFKFSILDDGSLYGDGLEGEQVLLQGVVDCALLDDDGIIVLDFKTDYVTEENLSELTERYRQQVRTYAHALQRIYRMEVKASYLYFFRLNRFVEV
jgi:ATP-dependent helicase/nuclease subunit A